MLSGRAASGRRNVFQKTSAPPFGGCGRSSPIHSPSPGKAPSWITGLMGGGPACGRPLVPGSVVGVAGGLVGVTGGSATRVGLGGSGVGLGGSGVGLGGSGVGVDVSAGTVGDAWASGAPVGVSVSVAGVSAACAA